uniref:Uncharacterized protein n=1 Tax=Panagrolaimus sp. ES5 TaxID=591445 RepID=A0AC34GUU4_9BILA
MSAIANLSTTFSSQTTTFASSLPVVLGVTAAGQPLIQNLVFSTATEIEQPPPIIPQTDGKLVLILSGVLANGESIVQGIASIQKHNSFNEHAISEFKRLKADSTATPPHSEENCRDSYAILQGGISESGVPLIQGLTFIPGLFSETLPTATPPSSLIGDSDYYLEKENNLTPQEEELFQKSSVHSLFNNQSLPDFQSDNAQEEECTLIQAQQQGVCCNDEFSHKLLPQEKLLTNKILLHSTPIDDTKLSNSLSYILSNLAKLKMVNQSQYSDVVERLYELEEEMKDAATGLPPDPSLTDLIGKILSAEYPNADLQIIVSSSRKTTTTKSFYETETPGMVGLEPDKLQELQRKLMTNISSPESAKDAAAPGAVPPGLHVPDAEIHPDAAVQKKEVHEEGYANADGSEVVAKKMTRVITTSQSAVSGVNEQPTYESRGGDFVRLKINKQIYDGDIDPQSHQIKLIPIKRVP